MELAENDKNRIIDFYLGHLKKNGIESAQTLNWTNKRNQLLRFNALARIGELQNASILDVGSGLGDLYDYLAAQRKSFEYYGIDIVPEFVTLAKQKYPSGNFGSEDLFAITKKYDYVLASGSLSFTVANNDLFYQEMIKKMYALATKGIGFNMLDIHYYTPDSIYAVYDPEVIAYFCKTFAAKTYLIRGYVEGDFTVFLYKDPKATFIPVTLNLIWSH
jgi:SAM-dependent methyltransferase